MQPSFRLLLSSLVLSAGLAACGLSSAAPQPESAASALPWTLAEAGWRTDAAWYDGRAEKAVYAATRSVYGLERRYLATAYTNKQPMDAASTVKASDSSGVEVFKHHWSERIPTENYDYDYSTASFLRTADLAPFKLTAATQDDCGASFKQLWRSGDAFDWWTSVYFPGAGMEAGSLPAAGLQSVDALTLVLRSFPFDDPERRAQPFELKLIPEQRSHRASPIAPEFWQLRYAGTETVGAWPAHRLELSGPSGRGARTYWFAADGTAPMLHALVRYQGPGGVSFTLQSLERSAYWER